MMSGRYDSYYRPRRSRREQQSDAIATALTVQIIICAILLLSANLAKKIDSTAYERFRSQFDVMVADTSGAARFTDSFERFTSGSGGFFAAVEHAISSFIATVTGNRSGIEVQREPNPADENTQEGDPALFGYSYLDSIQTATVLSGMGGMHPVDGISNVPLTAPAGSSLAPVMLGGNIKPPVIGRITSKFAYRYHPISDRSDFHTGIDIAAEEGRTILAALPGEVAEVGECDIYGKYIILQHATNLRTFYGHCSEIIAEAGMAVRQGERIAKVGSTGLSTGPHLHFSVIVDDTFTDPLWVLGDHIKVVE